MHDGDPHDEIERLEAQIEELTAKIEGCRKFILAARIAIAAGAALLAAILFGAIGFDPRAMLAGIAAILGGIVVQGSNDSTAKEAIKELTVAEAERLQLIGRLHLHAVAEHKSLR